MAGIQKSFPFEIVDDLDLGQEMAEILSSGRQYVRIGPKKYLFYKEFQSNAVDVYNMPLRNDDVFLVTFPKSGTTVMSELIYLVANDFDYVKAASKDLMERAPFLELFSFMPSKLRDEALERFKDDETLFPFVKFVTTPLTQLADTLPHPRTLKTHVPLSLLPPDFLDTTKVIYIARDPRDVAVSFYHMQCLSKFCSFTKDFKTHWNLFIDGKIVFNPFFEHLKEAWEKRDHPNMLFMFYDELVTDPTTVVKKVSSFLGKQPTDEQVAQLVSHVHIDNFRKNNTVNDSSFDKLGFNNKCNQTFIRKGKTGGWREYFDEEMTLQAENWIQLNLRDSDLRFPKN